MIDLEAFAGLVSLDHGLVVVSASLADGTIPVVNAGVLEHPGTGRPVVVLSGRPGPRATGTSTNASWPPSAGWPCSSRRSGPTATAELPGGRVE